MSFFGRWSNPKLICVLFFVAGLPYANTLLNSFVYDDTQAIVNNPYIRSFHYLRQIFTTDIWSFTGSPVAGNYYRPLMMFGCLLSYKLFGLRAFGFHLVNVFLHAAVTCMVFFVAARMLRDRGIAFGAAAMFALHPVHTESVAWITAVGDLEVAFFLLLTFWVFLGLYPKTGRRFWIAIAAMSGSFALALLSKEHAVTLPALATVYEHFYREDRTETTLLQKLSRYLVLWILTLAYILLRTHWLGAFVPNATARTNSIVLFSAIALIGQYIWKLIWPVHLLAFYVFHESSSPFDPRVLAGFVALLLGTVIFVYLWKTARTVSFALVWFVVTLSPVLNSKWMAQNVFAERYLYLPSVGFCWLAAYGLRIGWDALHNRRHVWRDAGVALVIITALLCTFRIVTRNRDWHDDLVLYRRTLAAAPDATPIRINLALAYQQNGDPEDAEQEYRRVLERDPSQASACVGLGQVRLARGVPNEAVAIWESCIRDNPWDPRPYYMLGTLEDSRKNWQRAQDLYRKVLSIGEYPSAANNLAYSYLQHGGDVDLALSLAQAARRHMPYSASIADTLGWAYVQKGNYDMAVGLLEESLRSAPNDASVQYHLALAYEKRNQHDKARQHFLRALAIDPSFPEAELARKAVGQSPTTK